MNTNPKQLTLIDVLPATPSDLRITQVDNFLVKDLPDIHPGKEASAQFLESIRRCGILCPIVVIKTGDQFVVKDGLRRLSAARAAGMETIKVMLIDCSAVHGNVLGLSMNEQRSENPIGELRMLVELIHAGADEKLISVATGMPVGRIRRRLRLTKLNKEWAELADRGAIKATVAEGLARRPVADQKRALRKFRKNGGKLKLTDLREMRQAEARAAVAALPAAMFEPESIRNGLPHGEVAELLNKARAQLPADHPAQHHLEMALRTLTGPQQSVGAAA
jgi:ParB/RepB/Spo0J family partition protein